MSTATQIFHASEENPKTPTDGPRSHEVPSEQSLSPTDASANGGEKGVDGAKDFVAARNAATPTPVKNVTVSMTDTQKKMLRAERFGVPVLLSEKEKLSSRAERFGTAPLSRRSDSSKTSEDQKRKARAERFGIIGKTENVDEEDRKKARLVRFGSNSKLVSEEEAKRKAREKRFAGAASRLSEKVAAGSVEKTTSLESRH